MKKNYVLRAAGAMLLACALTVGAISTSLAKYVSAASAAKQYVRVAAFKVQVLDKGGDVAKESDWKDITGTGSTATFDFDFYTTLHQSGDSLGTGNHPNTVIWPMNSVVNDGVQIIAPGTGGRFKVIVKNLSEVPILCKLALVNESHGDISMGYRFRRQAMNGTWSWSSSSSNGWSTANTHGANAFAQYVLAPGGTSTGNQVEPVEWRWGYEGSPGSGRDECDTTVGVAQQEALTKSVVKAALQLTVSQID